MSTVGRQIQSIKEGMGGEQLTAFMPLMEAVEYGAT